MDCKSWIGFSVLTVPCHFTPACTSKRRLWGLDARLSNDPRIADVKEPLGGFYLRSGPQVNLSPVVPGWKSWSGGQRWEKGRHVPIRTNRVGQREHHVQITALLVSPQTLRHARHNVGTKNFRSAGLHPGVALLRPERQSEQSASKTSEAEAEAEQDQRVDSNISFP